MQLIIVIGMFNTTNYSPNQFEFTMRFVNKLQICMIMEVSSSGINQQRC